jgi:hypothetical protein
MRVDQKSAAASMSVLPVAWSVYETVGFFSRMRHARSVSTVRIVSIQKHVDLRVQMGTIRLGHSG